MVANALVQGRGPNEVTDLALGEIAKVVGLTAADYNKLMKKAAGYVTAPRLKLWHGVLEYQPKQYQWVIHKTESIRHYMSIVE